MPASFQDECLGRARRPYAAAMTSQADFRDQPEPFDWRGLRVQAGYERQVSPGTLIAVRFESFRAQPPQGLTIFGRDGGKLTVDGWEDIEPARKIRLWSDDRSEVTVRYWNPRKSATLAIVNCFLAIVDGRESAEWWQPYRAMSVEDDGDR